jgi:4a-hydroxytetrahydrobiopterin dehydratase
MAKRKLLADDELNSALATLDGWKVVRGKLYREFRFDSFVEAFGFMASAAIEAEAMNHHPEWFNVYGTVKVHLVTHDLGGISTFDVELARKMNRLARR